MKTKHKHPNHASINPYASPEYVGIRPQAETGDEHRHRQAIAELAGPSLGLMLISGLWGVSGLDGCFVLIATDRQGGITPHSFAFNVAFLLIVCSSAALGFFGAICMRRGCRYRLSVVTSVLACFPVLSPGVVLGIPFGFWALAVLTRPHVRAAFVS